MTCTHPASRRNRTNQLTEQPRISSGPGSLPARHLRWTTVRT